MVPSQPASPKTDSEEQESPTASKAARVPAGFRVKRWLKHRLPSRSESRGKSEQGGKVVDLFLPGSVASCWLSNMERVQEGKGGHSRATGGGKTAVTGPGEDRGLRQRRRRSQHSYRGPGCLA